MSTALVASHPVAFGRRLRHARDRAGVTLAFAARRSGLSRTEVDLLERGRTSVDLDTLMLLAGLYDCPLGWLLTGTGEPTADSVGRDVLRPA